MRKIGRIRLKCFCSSLEKPSIDASLVPIYPENKALKQRKAVNPVRVEKISANRVDKRHELLPKLNHKKEIIKRY